MKSIIDSTNFRELGPFNSREIALIFCIALVIIYCLKSRKIRESILSVIEAFFAKKLTILYLITILYSAIPIIVIYYVGFWKTSIIKDALFWLLFSALPTLMTVNKADKRFFKDTLYDNIKFSVIVDFIVGQYTFHIFWEILLVIVSFFIGGIIAISENNEKQKSVNILFKRLTYIIGATILVISVYSFIMDIKNVVTFDKFEDFSLPIVLGLWFIPFLYLVHIYMIYENIHISIQYAINDHDVYKFARKRSLLHFNFNITSLRRWRDSLFLGEVRTKEDVLISFLDIRRLELVERNPPKVDTSQGWSPYTAKDFLKDNGIETNHYKKCYDNEWQAISSYIKLGSEIIDNDIAYYVTGNNLTAKQLKLVLNVNFKKNEDSALNKFIECSKNLSQAALGEPLPVEMSVLMLNNKTVNVIVASKKLSMSKNEFQNRAKGYTLIFSIEQL